MAMRVATTVEQVDESLKRLVARRNNARQRLNTGLAENYQARIDDLLDHRNCLQPNTTPCPA